MHEGTPNNQPPDAQREPSKDKPSSIFMELPARQKASYVRAAQRDGKKLVPWILAELDKAANR